MKKKRKKTCQNKRKKIISSKPSGSSHPTKDKFQHPLADTPLTSRFKAFLWPFPIAILGLILLKPESTNPIDDLRILFATKGFPLLLGGVGTILTLIDVLGRKRLEKIDNFLLETIGGRSRKIFLLGGFKRVIDYYRAYTGPGFFYERDVCFSFIFLMAVLDLFGFKSHRNFLTFDKILSVIIAALLTHSFYRLFVRPDIFPKPTPSIYKKFGRAIGFILMVLFTLPWTIFRLFLYLWAYFIYLPVDLLSSISSKLKFEGYLKVVGGGLIILSIILSYTK